MKVLLSVCFIIIGLFSANAQTAKVLVDNDKVKVTEYTSQPGNDVCGKGRHSHQGHVNILLTDAKVKVTNANGETEIENYSMANKTYTVTKNGKTETIPAESAFWAEGDTHTVTNVGKKPMKFYLVETK